MFLELPPAKQYGPILVRPARQSDFDSDPVPFRVTALVGELVETGEILGVGGIMWMPDGRAYLFTKLCDEHKKREHAVILHIAATKFLKQVRRAGVQYVTALPDPAIEDIALKWMKSLGLKYSCYGNAWVF